MSVVRGTVAVAIEQLLVLVDHARDVRRVDVQEVRVIKQRPHRQILLTFLFLGGAEVLRVLDELLVELTLGNLEVVFGVILLARDLLQY